MNRSSLGFVAIMTVFLLIFQRIAHSQINGPDQHNGVYVGSGFLPGVNGTGTVTAVCSIESIDPTLGQPTSTATLYHYFSTACTVTPDPDGTILAIQQQNVTCNSPNSPLDQKLLFQSGNGFRRSVTRDFHIYYIFTIS